MQFNSKVLSDTKAHWQVMIEGSEWAKYINQARTNLAKRLKVKGFRSDKIPANIIKQKISAGNILREAHKDAMQAAYRFAVGQKSTINPVSQPTAQVDHIDQHKYVVNFVFDIFREPKISKYTNFDIKKPVIEVTELEIDTVYHNYLDSKSEFYPKAGAAALHDNVVLDFVGYQDGHAFAGGKATNFAVTLGNKQLIPGFEEQLVGTKAGQTLDVKVTFPADYPKEELRNQKAVFKTTIKEIRSQKPPVLNQVFFNQIGFNDISTEKAFRERISSNLASQKEEQAKEEFFEELFKAIAIEAQVKVPASVLAKEQIRLKKEFEQKVQEQNLTLKQYKKRAHMTERDIDQLLWDDALLSVQKELIIRSVIKQEKMEVSEQEIKAEYKTLTDQMRISEEMLRESYLPETKIKDKLLREKVMDFLYQHNGNKSSVPKTKPKTHPKKTTQAKKANNNKPKAKSVSHKTQNNPAVKKTSKK